MWTPGRPVGMAESRRSKRPGWTFRSNVTPTPARPLLDLGPQRAATFPRTHERAAVIAPGARVASAVRKTRVLLSHSFGTVAMISHSQGRSGTAVGSDLAVC